AVDVEEESAVAGARLRRNELAVADTGGGDDAAHDGGRRRPGVTGVERREVYVHLRECALRRRNPASERYKPDHPGDRGIPHASLGTLLPQAGSGGDSGGMQLRRGDHGTERHPAGRQWHSGERADTARTLRAELVPGQRPDLSPHFRRRIVPPVQTPPASQPKKAVWYGWIACAIRPLPFTQTR